ncbi:hypothetical protein Salat_1738800 [Sesamum alatum]|uniref:Late embryogenesis abundant protein LEA-2 subgroup domain-containing protein n=1 Tax=Sesamum alatum TaxID=300844 RepID=A0AAE2CKF4_9LAMI|nr:hypothetical protein Salat_1738800 [Sesamum alatum]
MAEEFSSLLEPLAECELDNIGDCIGKYICIIITLPLTIWFMLTFRIHMPKCHLQQLYLPSLDLSNGTAAAATINPTLFFDLELENTMNDHSVRYSDINLTFYYGPNRNFTIANYRVPGFYQGKEKTAYRRDVVETHDLPWDDAIRKVSNGSTAVFRVDLVAKPTFRYWFLVFQEEVAKGGGQSGGRRHREDGLSGSFRFRDFCRAAVLISDKISSESDAENENLENETQITDGARKLTAKKRTSMAASESIQGGRAAETEAHASTDETKEATGFRFTAFASLAERVAGDDQSLQTLERVKARWNARYGDTGSGTMSSSVGALVGAQTLDNRTKQYFWYAKKQRLTVGGIMDVGSAGLMESNVAIRLR